MTTRYLSDIVQTVRDRGDYRNPVKFTDEIITREIQAAFAELYQIIAGVNEGYFDTYATLTTRSNVAFVALPSDAWRVRAIDIIDSSGAACPLDQVGIDQRNRYGVATGRPLAYRLTARGIDLYPTPNDAYTLRLLYTPSAPSLSAPIFVGSSMATFAIDGSDNLLGTMTTPSGIAEGDTMLIVMVTEFGEQIQDAYIPIGWHTAASMIGIGGSEKSAIVYRRIADGTEDATYVVNANAGTGDAVAGMAMLVYRNLDPAVDVVDSDSAKVTSSSSFSCPSLTLASATDMYLGVGWDFDGTTTFTKPFGSTIRFTASQTTNAVARQLAAFDIQTKVIGDSPVQTLRSSSAVNGIALGMLFAVNPFREFFNGWEEYIVYGACIRLSGEEESTRSDWVTLQDRARQLAVNGATGRRSQEPQLIPLLDDC